MPLVAEVIPLVLDPPVESDAPLFIELDPTKLVPSASISSEPETVEKKKAGEQTK